jgi:hypothetical protein
MIYHLCGWCVRVSVENYIDQICQICQICDAEETSFWNSVQQKVVSSSAYRGAPVVNESDLVV